MACKASGAGESHAPGRSWLRRAAGGLLVLLAVLVLSLSVSQDLRQLGREQLLAAHWSWERSVAQRQLGGVLYEDPQGRFVVAAAAGAEAFVPVVAQAAAASFEPLAARYQVRPQEPVFIIIHPEQESLARAFGWPRTESAMGVYRGGVVRVLAPDQWIQAHDAAARDAIFLREGPVTHELAHLFLDLSTGGNYPRWFSEGMAQYEEHLLQGWIWRRGLWILEREGPIAMEQLDGAIRQAAEAPRAYYQSLSLLRYLAWSQGEGALYELVGALAAGQPFAVALPHVTGLNPHELVDAWWLWFEAGEPTAEEVMLHGRW